MTTTFKTIGTTAIGFALVSVLSLAAQEQEDRGLKAPIKGAVSASAESESLELDGTITVFASVTDENGSKHVSYRYEIAGTAIGRMTQSSYELRGAGTGKSPFDVAPPADAGMDVSFTVSQPGTQYGFDLLLQATVDESGKVSALVARAVVPKP